MEFIITWESKDVKVTLPFFVKGINLPKGLTLKGNWHFVGKPNGVALVEAQDPAMINVFLATLPSALVVEVNAVIADEIAKKAHLTRE